MSSKYGLLYISNDEEEAVAKIIELLNTPDIKKKWKEKRDIMLGDKESTTDFMLALVENSVNGKNGGGN